MLKLPAKARFLYKYADMMLEEKEARKSANWFTNFERIVDFLRKLYNCIPEYIICFGIFFYFLKTDLVFILKTEIERERLIFHPPIHWFTPKIVSMTQAVPGQARNQ